MKRLSLVLSGLGLLIISVGCTNYSVVRKVDALTNKYNEMQTQLIALDKKIEKTNEMILAIKGPPTADLATLQERIDVINEQYRKLAEQIVELQKKAGVKPAELLPPSFK